VTVLDAGSPAAAVSSAEGAPVTGAPVASRGRPTPRATVAIAGWGAAVPPTRVTNADLEARLDTSDAWIRERSGIAERRLASPDRTTAGMAVDAVHAALRNAQLRVVDLDLLIVATSTPETPMPPTASFVAAELTRAGEPGADPVAVGPGTVDLNGACAGFPYALGFAGSMVSTGLARTVAVVGAETMSRIVDPEDRSTAVLFGDGAAALILQAPGQAALSGSEVDPSRAPGILATDLVSDPAGVGLLQVPAGGAARPASAATVAAREHFMQMDGREVFRRAVRAVVESVGRTLERAGVTAAEVDVFVPHQANARIVDAVVARTGIDPERTAGNIDRFGNTSAASIPLVLAEEADNGRIREGDLVLLTGFGAGLTVGSVLLRWGRP